MIDKSLVLRKLAEIDEYVGQIKEYKDLTALQYSSDWKIQRIIERTLQMMIETCVDIASHIISDKGFRIPKSYADTFRVLYEKDILNKRLFEALEKMAKFRNIVVHQYDRVDSKIVVGILKNNLNDFRTFKDSIVKTLKTDI